MSATRTSQAPSMLTTTSRRGCGRPLLASLLWLSLAMPALAAEDGDRTPLLVRKEDEIHLKNGGVVTGRIIETLPDGGVVVKVVGSSAESIDADKIGQILNKQTAGKAVQSRGAQDLAANDLPDLDKTLHWGLANDGHDAVVELARNAIKNHASTELAEMLVPILLEINEPQLALDLLTELIKSKPNWSKGYELKAQALKNAGRNNDLSQLVDDWLAMDPTAQMPLRFRADAAEMSGDLRTARESYHKLFDLHQDWASGVGFARATLRLGNPAEALDTVQKLIQANQCVDEAKAVGGAALLAEGDEDKAKAMLTEAASGKLERGSADFVAYDLGLIAYRHGDDDLAQKYWKGLEVPAAKLGLAMLDERPSADAMPAELVGVQAEYNAGLALEAKDFGKAESMIGQVREKRRPFLTEVVALRVPSVEAVKGLEATSGAESQHWQIYGDLQLRRWGEAESLLNQLPENDGYAAVCRIFVAASRHDLATARLLFEKAKDAQSPPAPHEYMKELARELEGTPQTFTETFDGSIDDLTTRDWSVVTNGTGIQLRTDNKHLIFEGTQASCPDPLSSLQRPVQAKALHFAMAMFDCGDLAGGNAGIMLLDKSRLNGIAFGVMGNNRLGWRQLTDGTWAAWTSLDLDAHPTQQLRIELDHGAVTVRCEDPSLNKVVAHGMFKGQEDLVIGLFGTADAGAKWQLQVHDFTDQWTTGEHGQTR